MIKHYYMEEDGIVTTQLPKLEETFEHRGTANYQGQVSVILYVYVSQKKAIAFNIRQVYFALCSFSIFYFGLLQQI